MATADEAKKLAETDYYFNSYSHYGIHMEMLKDRHRTESYRDAILMNEYMFKDKYVMDVGCGTSILSLFAAKAGAKRVVAIDCSSIANQAREIVKLNGYENVITVIQGKVEEVTLPADVPHIDIFISEWMGYFLLYESMLNTVLIARDRFGNKKDGVKLLPSEANMYCCAITDAQYKETKFEVWNDVSGIDYSHFRRQQFVEPLVDSVDQKQCVTDVAKMFHMDLHTVTEPELAWTSDFVLTAQRDDTVHALSVHFDTPFTAGHEHVVLDTAPWKTPTHWRQTVLYLYNPLHVKAGDKIHVTLDQKPNVNNPRDLDILVHLKMDGQLQRAAYSQDFRLR
jgi:protein arginine N-methyltransferase 1